MCVYIKKAGDEPGKKMMNGVRKGLLILSSFAIMLVLAGCGNLSEYVQNEITSTAESEIQSSEEYQLYEKYLADGILGEDGLFPTPVPTGSSDSVNSNQTVKVSIAANSFLNCVYYTDEGTKAPIASTEVYLAPGESLYVANVSINNDISNLYTFSQFRIWSYDQDGRRGSTPYKEVKNSTGLLLRVPDDYQGTGFSVEPIGSYSDRNITARAYYLSNGVETNLPSGRWEVNSKPFDGSTVISPVDSYTIIYNYETYQDDYYFVASSPACWYSKESNHTVIFREVSSNEQNTEFAVEMHQYVTLNIKNSCRSWNADIPFFGDHGEGIIQSIMRGDEPLGQGHIGEASFAIRRLKVGDMISIRVGKEYKITGTGVNVGTAIPLGSNAENGYEYTIVVPDTNKGISIEITERNSNAEGTYQGYNLANADVTITRSNGVTLKIGDELPGDDEKVTLTITPHDGYYIDGYTDKNTFSLVKKNYKFSKLETEILSLLKEHPAIHFITLNLVFADESGQFTFKLDGKEVTTSPVVNVRVGQKLSVEYKANSGYKITHSWFGSTAFYNAWTWAGGTDSISDDVKITADMDGTTIDRTTFGIVVEKAG